MTDMNDDPQIRRPTADRPHERPSDARDAGREPIFDVRDLAVSYGGNAAVRDITLDIGQNRDHRAHRPVRLRQEHAASAASTA